ncbi:MAG: ABC transporter permease [Anaerolineales bacterium]|jgi:ABC-2 type transport system permease protein
MEKAKAIPIYDSARQGSPAIEEMRAVIDYRYLIVQLVRRDILTRYKRSALGVAWTMLNPLGTMLILTIVFSQAFGGSQKGYAAYVLSGLIAWNFFAQSTNAATLHLVWGGSLLKKIYIPRTSFAISATGTGLINLLLSLIPLVLVMLIIRVPIRWTIVLLPIPILFLAMFALGVGLIVSTMAIYYADIAEMYQILLTAWMYLSPVIYSPEILPEAFRYWIVLLNPMFYLIELFRMPIYYGQVPGIDLLLISAGIATFTLFAGWMFFTSKSDEFAYRV